MPSKTSSLRFAAVSFGMLAVLTYPVVGCGDGVGYPIRPIGSNANTGGVTGIVSTGATTGGATTGTSSSTSTSQGGAATGGTSSSTIPSTSQGGTATGGTSSTNVPAGGAETGGSATGGTSGSSLTVGGAAVGGTNGSFIGAMSGGTSMRTQFPTNGGLPPYCKDRSATPQEVSDAETALITIINQERTGGHQCSDGTTTLLKFDTPPALQSQARLESCCQLDPACPSLDPPQGTREMSVSCGSTLSADSAWQAILNGSSGSRANLDCFDLMNPAFTQLGVGLAMSSQGDCYWTVVLAGKPRPQ